MLGGGGEQTAPLRDNWGGWDRPFPSRPNRTEVMYGRDKGNICKGVPIYSLQDSRQRN